MSSTDRIISITDRRIFDRISATLNLETGEVVWVGGWMTYKLSKQEKSKFELEWRKNFKIQE
jgi:hypothetical protein